MDDLFVCGNFVSITCGTWIGLWNGAIGALVGAAVAAYAIVKTIRTQRNLFQIQLSRNYMASQLADHRRNVELNKQLEAQREDVMLQLKFQADEARRQRELAAIADLVAAANAMLKRFSAGRSAIEDLVLQGDAAAIRWRIDMNHRGLADELWHWAHYLGQLALRLHDAVLRKEEAYCSAGDAESASAAFDALNDGVTELTFAAIGWPSASLETRDSLVAKLTAERQKHENDLLPKGAGM